MSLPEKALRRGPSAIDVSSNIPIKKPRLTHFISLSIGHHDELRETWNRVSASLLEASPPISGIDESIILKPGSLHFTLGVLSLRSNKKQKGYRMPEMSEKAALGKEVVDINDTEQPSHISPIQHTIEDALKLLHTLQTPIMTILNGDKLVIPLEYLDVMRSKPNQSPEQSHVLWAGPDLTSETGKRLNTVCAMIHSAFQEAGMLQDDDRPLKLHCTLINTVYRKIKCPKKGNWTNKKRIPFSFPAVVSSLAMTDILQERNFNTHPKGEPYKIKLGSWSVTEVQLCEMGNKTADGAYRSVGAVSLQGDVAHD